VISYVVCSGMVPSWAGVGFGVRLGFKCLKADKFMLLFLCLCLFPCECGDEDEDEDDAGRADEVDCARYEYVVLGVKDEARGANNAKEEATSNACIQ